MMAAAGEKVDASEGKREGEKKKRKRKRGKNKAVKYDLSKERGRQ